MFRQVKSACRSSALYRKMAFYGEHIAFHIHRNACTRKNGSDCDYGKIPADASKMAKNNTQRKGEEGRHKLCEYNSCVTAHECCTYSEAKHIPIHTKRKENAR